MSSGGAVGRCLAIQSHPLESIYWKACGIYHCMIEFSAEVRVCALVECLYTSRSVPNSHVSGHGDIQGAVASLLIATNTRSTLRSAQSHGVSSPHGATRLRVLSRTRSRHFVARGIGQPPPHATVRRRRVIPLDAFATLPPAAPDALTTEYPRVTGHSLCSPLACAPGFFFAACASFRSSVY
jgi:hypothetical protein